jgi:hypothetical protein
MGIGSCFPAGKPPWLKLTGNLPGFGMRMKLRKPEEEKRYRNLSVEGSMILKWISRGMVMIVRI